MASRKSFRLIGFALCLMIALAMFPTRALADAPGTPDSSAATPLMNFAAEVSSGKDIVTGVYAVDSFSFPVVQQPKSNFAAISTAPDTVTQFGLAAQFGNVGLLAHNYLAGAQFFDLTEGQRIYLVYGTGRVEAFTVTEILQYQALSPYSIYSEFKSLDDGVTLTVTEMFNLVYTGARHLTLQTCIENNGNSSWGRLFVIAEPVVPGSN